MGYLYAALWYMAAILLLLRFRKEGAAIYLLAAYFIFAGTWWLVDQFTETDLLNGVYGWILRMISVVLLIVLGIVYAADKKRRKKR